MPENDSRPTVFWPVFFAIVCAMILQSIGSCMIQISSY